ncbi:hypothetical protein [Asticcacaulis sp. AND118]|uniref:hypothetical protein n=1 Tax=Asticcacaulis sp. AND118 TaxID=2840468 RepID=UPI001CFF9013|nr:hypothetical protein [Asticcacaulis sp. AND118]UDF05273.1 hypothetical protein LH365_13750 [Asticcacaulis sp. AND118]
MARIWAKRFGGLGFVVAVALSACSAEAPPADSAANASESAVAEIAAPVAPQSASAAASTASQPAYAGRWTGVEGTYMTITPKSGDAYEVVMADLDGPKTYAGTLKPDGLHVDRNGTPLVIVPGDGEATGMKWLADKSDCLVVAANEGYCRD